MFTQIHELMPKLLRRHHIYDDVRASQILLRVKEYYYGVLPHIEMTPSVYRRKIVYVDVPSSVVAYECHQHVQGCIECLHIDAYEVHDIQFRLR